MSLNGGRVIFEMRNGGKRRLVQSKSQYNDGTFHKATRMYFLQPQLSLAFSFFKYIERKPIIEYMLCLLSIFRLSVLWMFQSPCSEFGGARFRFADSKFTL